MRFVKDEQGNVIEITLAKGDLLPEVIPLFETHPYLHTVDMLALDIAPNIDINIHYDLFKYGKSKKRFCCLKTKFSHWRACLYTPLELSIAKKFTDTELHMLFARWFLMNFESATASTEMLGRITALAHVDFELMHDVIPLLVEKLFTHNQKMTTVFDAILNQNNLILLDIVLTRMDADDFAQKMVKSTLNRILCPNCEHVEIVAEKLTLIKKRPDLSLNLISVYIPEGEYKAKLMAKYQRLQSIQIFNKHMSELISRTIIKAVGLFTERYLAACSHLPGFQRFNQEKAEKMFMEQLHEPTLSYFQNHAGKIMVERYLDNKINLNTLDQVFNEAISPESPPNQGLLSTKPDEFARAFTDTLSRVCAPMILSTRPIEGHCTHTRFNRIS